MTEDTSAQTMTRPAWLRMSGGAGLLDAQGRPQPTIFEQIGAASAESGAVNLGQGFPETPSPPFLVEAAAQAMLDGHTQYAPPAGQPALREAICERARADHGWEISPDHVMVAAGATEALAAVLMAFLRPGDEVISFDPSYDEYGAHIALAQAVHIRVPLAFDAERGFSWDGDAFAAALSERTRAVVLNDPHNPTGFQFPREAKEELILLARERDILVITDEVYEHQCFEEPHVPLASLAPQEENIVTISSAGKTFSVTGWKVGWVIASPQKLEQVQAVKNYLSFSNAPAAQLALAQGYSEGMDWVAESRTALRRSRDRFATLLREAGFSPLPTASTFFMLAAPPAWLLGASSDWKERALILAREAGVAAIPVAAFCDQKAADREEGSERPEHRLLRFAFCKPEAMLEEAGKRLREEYERYSTEKAADQMTETTRRGEQA